MPHNYKSQKPWCHPSLDPISDLSANPVHCIFKMPSSPYHPVQSSTACPLEILPILQGSGWGHLLRELFGVPSLGAVGARGLCYVDKHLLKFGLPISAHLTRTRTSHTSVTRELGGRQGSRLLIAYQDASLASQCFLHKKKALVIILLTLYDHYLGRCVNLLDRGGTPGE